MLRTSLERTESCPSELDASARRTDSFDPNPRPEVKERNFGSKSKYFLNRSHSDSEDFKETKKPVRKLPHKKKSCKINKKYKPKINVNNLREYTDAFGDVCKAGGLDVNPDDLQLAIALSKSTNESADITCTSQPETNIDQTCCEERDKLLSIRRTLEGFGFKVSSSLDKLGKKILGKKLPPDSNLINFSQERKDQIVNNKVSQILFESIPSSTFIKNEYRLSSTTLKEIVCLEKRCYFKCSQSLMIDVEDSASYYTGNIVEPSSSKIGCLLRDWSTIPGREKSPTRNEDRKDFDKNLLIKNHLDTLLSGTFESIFKCYSSSLKAFSNVNTLNVPQENKLPMDNHQNLSPPRSYSPDIFDDSYNSSVKKPDCSELSIIISESSDDELPNVYLSRPKKTDLENYRTDSTYCQKSSFNRDKTNSSHCQSSSISDINVSIGENSNNDEENHILNHTSQSDPPKSDTDFIKCKYGKKYNLDVECIEYEIPTGDLKSSFKNASDLKSNQQSQNSFYEINHNANSNNVSINLDDECMKNEKSISDLENCNFEKTTENNQQSQNSVDDYSQNGGSDIFIISDDELDYSISKAPQKIQNCNSTQNQDLGISLLNGVDREMVNERFNSIVDIEPFAYSSFNMESVDKNCRGTTVSKLYRSSILDPIFSFNSSENVPTKEKTRVIESNLINEECTSSNTNSYDVLNNLPNVHLTVHGKKSKIKLGTDDFSQFNHTDGKPATMLDFCNSPNKNTPMSKKYVFKSDNVTPKMDFNLMDSPQIVDELSKYGLKPLKRKRAVQILEHIYEQTHPLKYSDIIRNEQKKYKLDVNKEQPIIGNIESVNDQLSNSDVSVKSNLYERDCDLIQIKKIDSDSDWIYPTKAKSKVCSCIVTLDIVFHNYVSLRSKLRDAILRYEPIDIETVHRDLKLSGHKFKPNDLMTFMDRKCITIKVSSKNPERRKQKKA